MSQKINKFVTITGFLLIIFVMALFSTMNLVKKYIKSPVSEANPVVVENDFKKSMFLRNEIIELQGFTQKMIGNSAVEDPELGSIVRTNWGKLTSLPGEKDFSEFINRLDAITEGAQKSGAKQIYAQAPFKILPQYENEQLPVGFTTKANENADAFINHMKQKGVEVFDFRDYLVNSTNLSPETLFYNTDHHWTIPTAFEAFSGFVNYLDRKYGYLNKEELGFVTNKDNYNFITMKDSYLGSWGRRTGLMYAGCEDFTYITPAFDTHFSIKRVAGDAVYENSGSFYDMVMSPKRVEKDKFGASDEDIAAGYGTNGVYTDLYSVYMDGFTAEMQIVNQNIKSDKKVLIFHDSFGFPFSSFMSLSAKETRVIDLRNWGGDIPQYISDFQPDFVITLYNPDQ